MKTGLLQVMNKSLRKFNQQIMLEAQFLRRWTPEMDLKPRGSAVAGRPSDLESQKLEPEAWMSEPGNWKMESRSPKLEPGTWKLESGVPGSGREVEDQAALQGARKCGPRGPWAQYINR